MFSPEQLRQAEDLLALYRQAGRRLATAESCTGGLVAACLTEIAGSSDVVERGFVTYSNEAKIELLDVPGELIERVGAVSGEVAEAMARGALSRSRADVAVSITGVAGPGGATASKPVGLVHLASATADGELHGERHVFPGDRPAVRVAALEAALRLLRQALRTQPGT